LNLFNGESGWYFGFPLQKTRMIILIFRDKERGVPMVFFDRASDDLDIPAVVIDDL